MPLTAFNVSLFDIVLSVSRALDLLSPEISDHHHRVAYVASRLAAATGVDPLERRNIVVAGALHDVGAVSLVSRLSLLDYSLAGYKKTSHHPLLDNIHQHGFDGYALLQGFKPFAAAAEAVRFHHVEWNHGRGAAFGDEPVPFASHILYLADRVAVLPNGPGHILTQAAGIRQQIMEGSGRLYMPELVEAFLDVSDSEAFWLDLASPHKEEIIRNHFGADDLVLDIGELYELARLFGCIIDYRSPYTARHSHSVAAVAEILAGLAGMQPHEQRLMGVSGFLHDVGKLAVPAEILDKPSTLTPEEMMVVKQHPYHSYRILSAVPGLHEIITHGALHHERLDGYGYPFRVHRLPLASRVVAVADVFTAVSEDRPYRKGMPPAQALAALDMAAQDGALDEDLVALVHTSLDRFCRLVTVSANQA